MVSVGRMVDHRPDIERDRDHVSRRRQEALERFERTTDLPLLVLALAMIPLLLAPRLFDLRGTGADAVVAVEWFIWAVFAVDYVVRLILTTDRWRFVRGHWLDLIIIVLPFLRPLRLVRSARVLRLLRLARLGAFLGRAAYQGRRLLVGHGLHYALIVTMLVMVAAAALVHAIEAGSGGTIRTFGDALWWAVATVTTVGYGDAVPGTAAGRGIAAALMVAGIALFGVLTANIAAFFLEHDQEAAPDTALLLEQVVERLDAIEKRLDPDER